MLNPPRIMLVPVAAQAGGKVMTPNVQQQQSGFAMQAVYPIVLPDARCSHFSAKIAAAH